MANHNNTDELLIEQATPSLYIRNAFRVLNLPVDATPRDIKRHLEKVELEIKLKASVSRDKEGASSSHIGDGGPLNELRAAAQRLSDPETRLIDEFFWYWPLKFTQSEKDGAIQKVLEGDLGAAVSMWNEGPAYQKAKYIKIHNLAVYYHMMVLEAEAGSAEKGGASDTQPAFQLRAAEYWNELLGKRTFWTKLSERIQELEDPRLTTELSSTFKKQLVDIVLLTYARGAANAALEGDTEKARRFRRLIDLWPEAESNKGYVCLKAISPIREHIKTIANAQLSDAKHDLVHADKYIHELASSLTIKQSLEAIDLLLYLPETDATRIGIHDTLAEQIRELCRDFGNKTELWSEVASLLGFASWVPSGKSEKERYTEAIEQAEEYAQSDFLWKQKGYYDLPQKTLDALEAAYEDFQFRKWDSAIQKLEALFSGTGEKYTTEQLRIINKPMAMCYALRGIEKMNRAYEIMKEPPYTIQQILHKAKDNPASLLFGGERTCAACSTYLYGNYYTYELKDYPLYSFMKEDVQIRLCDKCGRAVNKQRDNQRKSVKNTLQAAARDLLLAQKLDPGNKGIKDQAEQMKTVLRSSGVSLPVVSSSPKKEEKPVPKQQYYSEPKTSKSAAPPTRAPVKQEKKKKNGWRIFFGIAALVGGIWFCVAISSPSTSSTSSTSYSRPYPTSTPRPRPTQTPAPVNVSEHFSSSSSSFPTGKQGGVTAKISEGKYVFDVDANSNGFTTNGIELRDGTISVETDYLIGSDPGSSGHQIWFRAGKDSGYGLLVRGDGAYVVISDEGTDLEEIVPSRYHNSVSSYWETNFWRIEMDGAHFTIYCNNSVVADFTDYSHRTGSVYLGGFSFSDYPVVVTFDNLTIREK